MPKGTLAHETSVKQEPNKKVVEGVDRTYTLARYKALSDLLNRT